MIYQNPNRGVKIIQKNLITYADAWSFQEERFDEIVQIKLENRNKEKPLATPNYLIFCEHTPVYTLGKSGSLENLLLSSDELEMHGIEFYKTNRGGDITLHAPGQLIMYPLLDLENFFTDIHLYLRNLEEAVILTLHEFGISAGRFPGYTGVWIDSDNERARKICAMGVRCSRWVSMHGIALNINNDLGLFDHIVPCGIKDKDVTSMQRELGKSIDFEAVTRTLARHFASVFHAEFV
jgi:lipoyl(octanoyl) transferase